MMFSLSRPMTAIEALNAELERLQTEMESFYFDNEDKKSTNLFEAYKILLSQRETIQKALIDLSKVEAGRVIK